MQSALRGTVNLQQASVHSRHCVSAVIPLRRWSSVLSHSSRHTMAASRPTIASAAGQKDIVVLDVMVSFYCQ
jgi:hypothetical protein